MQGVFAESSLRKQAWRNPKEGRVGCLHQNIFTRKVTDIAFTSDFCNNYSYSASPTSLYLTSPRPRPTRPHVPYLISSSLSSRVPKSQVPTHSSRCPRPLVPVPLLYTAHNEYISLSLPMGTYRCLFCHAFSIKSSFCQQNCYISRVFLCGNTTSECKQPCER